MVFLAVGHALSSSRWPPTTDLPRRSHCLLQLRLVPRGFSLTSAQRAPELGEDIPVSGPHHHPVGWWHSMVMPAPTGGQNCWKASTRTPTLSNPTTTPGVAGFVVTALWFLVERAQWRFEPPNSNRRRFIARFAPFFCLWRSVRDFGKASTHKSTKQHEVTHHG